MTQEASLLKRTEEAIALLRLLQEERVRALADLAIARSEKDEMEAVLAQVESSVDEMLSSAALKSEPPREGLRQELEECQKALQQTKAELERAKQELQRAEFRVRTQASKMRRQAPQMGREDWENVAKTARKDPEAFMREIGERGLLRGD